MEALSLLPSERTGLWLRDTRQVKKKHNVNEHCRAARPDVGDFDLTLWHGPSPKCSSLSNLSGDAPSLLGCAEKLCY